MFLECNHGIGREVGSVGTYRLHELLDFVLRITL
jgi:hypothetical protein